MKKVILSVSMLLILPGTLLAGTSFGLMKAAKKTVNKLDEKVTEKKAELSRSTGTITGNSSPVITSLVAVPVYVSTNATSVITCTASDPNGDNLSYSWSATSGAISGTGSQISWMSPSVAGLYQVSVTVSDGRGGSVQGHIDFAITYAPELPDTGQTVSYTTTFGEDHDYQPADTQPSYTDNGNGTITDNRTGLMWAKDGNGPGCNNGNRLTWDQSISFCAGLNYAGYSDWRLPNIKELESLVNYQASGPAINSTYFPNSSDLWYSSTQYVPDGTEAVVVYFNLDGNVHAIMKTYAGRTRCVRDIP